MKISAKLFLVACLLFLMIVTVACGPAEPEPDPVNRYTVTYVTNGGTAIPAVTVEYGTTLDAPAEPSRDGHRFIAWCSDAAMQNKVEFPLSVTKDLTLYAAWNEQVDLSALLKQLLAEYKADPYTYIPATMRPGYAGTVLPATTVAPDYASFVPVSEIHAGGFGEQWHMITENLDQSRTFYKALAVLDGLTSVSVASFENYLDKNPSETAEHTFAHGEYRVAIRFEKDILAYVLEYELSGHTAQIALSMNVKTSEKTVHIQLSDANALTYTVTKDAYCFAIKYLGIRRAYFDISKDNAGKVSGHIYEYLTAADKELESAADFQIDGNYVTAVGSKASGIPGFTGVIAELYDVKTGKLISYEVKESLKSIVYNTLWFDLSSVSGIQSIRYREADQDTTAAFYVNGLLDAWESKNVGGASAKMFSRRYDLEFRTQYFYAYDAVNDSYTEIKMQVPMLFVQEECLDTLTEDVQSKNAGVTPAVTLSPAALSRVQNDYRTLIPIFEDHKADMSAERVVAFIGDKVQFD